MGGDDISDLRSHRYFSKAIEAIKNHPYWNEMSFLHAAVLVRGGNILAIEYNKPSRNSFIDVHKHHEAANIHAECSVILTTRNKINLKGTKIFVARMRKGDGSLSMSMPCLLCRRVMRNYGIKRAYYSISDFEYGVLKPKDINFKARN